MIRLAVIGLGKMGLSHHAIARMHPDIVLVAACDTNRYVTDVLARHTKLACHADYQELLGQEQLDAVIVATPSRSHAPIVQAALERDLHVFCEKPFVLDVADGERLVELAETRGLVTQVGYHFRFVAAFEEAARVVRCGALGAVHHVRAEAYGPVVIRTKGSTWRAAREEGGGALYDYACHALDLVGFIVGAPSSVHGVTLNRVYSRAVDDEVYCALRFANGASGQLAVNWSDESFRKMATTISVWGSNGRLVANRQECQIYLKKPVADLPDLRPGWTVRYTTDLTKEVWYYLRGEEYSAQIDYFAQSIRLGRTDGQNAFRSALETDRVVAWIAARGNGGEASVAVGEMPRAKGGGRRLLPRLFG